MAAPKLLRHERLDDLLHASEDLAPRKTRRIEWIGERSPFEDDRVVAKYLMGMYKPLQMKAIQLAAAQAITRVDKHRDRLMEHEHQHAMGVVKGLNRTYYFTSSSGYICDVDYHDVDVLLGGPYGHEFVDLDARDPDEPLVKQFSDEVFKLVALDAMGRDDARVDVGHKAATG